ncbi:MAG: relaxase/mobilization nuclease domain-containing protein [Candidatus Pacebacteria bacterium]|nr:relaxase/mobilization nuclease domain-containing protein [Candidatus Paceibacterota bacterium]
MRDWRYFRGRQAIVKVASTLKSRQGVLNSAHYCSRERAEDIRNEEPAIPMLDRLGNELTGERIIEEVKRWNLRSDEENHSKTARGLIADGDAEAVKQLPLKARLHNTQVHHIVLSAVSDSDDFERDVERLKAAAKVTIDRMFVASGHRVLWCVHTDKAPRIHTHVLIKSVSEFGGRLRTDWSCKFTDAIRTEFGMNLVAAGLPHEVTRREDRWETRSAVMRGDEPLRPHKSMGRYKRKPLSEKVPAWWEEFGEGYIQRVQAKRQDYGRTGAWNLTRLKQLLTKSRQQKTRKNIPPELKPIFREIEHSFIDPVEALRSWVVMASEGVTRTGQGTLKYPNRALAIWWLHKQPSAFGEVTSDAEKLRDNDSLARMIEETPLITPEYAPLPVGKKTLAAIEGGAINPRAVFRDRMRVAQSLLGVADYARLIDVNDEQAKKIAWVVEDALKQPVVNVVEQGGKKRRWSVAPDSPVHDAEKNEGQPKRPSATHPDRAREETRRAVSKRRGVEM